MNLMMDKGERLLKIQLHIRYKDVPPTFDFRRRIITTFTDKEITPDQQQKLDKVSDTIQVISKKHKKRFRIEAHQTTIVLEDISEKEAERCILDAVENIKKELGIKNADGIRVRQIFALPSGKDFPATVDLFRRGLLNESNPLVKRSTDVGLPLDFQSGEFFVHTMNGPMNREQLQKDFLEFEGSNIPENFIFVDIETRKNSMINLDQKGISAFLSQHAEIVSQTLNEWRELFKEPIGL